MTTAFDEEGVVAGLWEQVDALAASRIWQPDEVIYREGDPPAGVHIIRSGQIDLVYAARNGVVKPLRESTRGDILGLSPHTVNKHLEHVFEKLGVKTRAAATALASRELG